jgi:hypothetical protein
MAREMVSESWFDLRLDLIYWILIKVPVVTIFTKMDALDKKAFSELLKAGKPFKDAKREAPFAAKVKFEQEYLNQLPVAHRKHAVQLRGT